MRQAVLAIAAGHPAYAGHFPGHPVFPGAALLDAALGTIVAAHRIDLKDWQLDGAKFLSGVLPGETPELEHDAPRANLIRFSVKVGERMVASGSLSLRGPAR